MKKIFTFLVAFLTTVSGAVWGQENETYSGSHDAIEINGGGIKRITFNDLTIDADAACKISGNTTVYLTLVGTNTLTSNRDNAGIYVEEGSTLIITKESEGASLTARCFDDNTSYGTMAAGIGGSNINNGNFGTIIIEGGTITAICETEGASAHANGAGIGGGTGSTSGIIIIKGGTIKAACIDSFGDNTVGYPNKQAVGAGIGGGYAGTVTAIAILGGNVTAWNEGCTAGLYNYVGQNIGNGYEYEGDGASIIFGNWDEATDNPVINYSTIDKSDFLDARGGTQQEGFGIVTMPANAQMVLKSDPTCVLNAYKVVYNSNLPEGAKIVGGDMPTTMVYGPSTSYRISSLSNLTTEVNAYTYQFVPSHWLNQSNAWVASDSEATTNSGPVSNLIEIPYGAAWVLKSASLRYLDNQGLQSPLNIYGPEEANFTITETPEDGTYSSLATVGLQQKDRQIIKKEDYTEVPDKTYKVQLNFVPTNTSVEALKGDIVITVSNTPDAVTDLTIQAAGSNLVYNGKVRDNNEAIKITDKDGYPVRLDLLTVEYSTDKSSWSSELKNAGHYYVKITGKDNSAYTGTQTTENTIVVIDPVGVTVTSVGTATYDMNIGMELSDYSDTKIEFSGIIESEKEAILKLLSWTGTVDPTAALTAGTYEDAVTYTIKVATENAEAAANYNLPTEAKGDLKVIKTGDDKDPIQPGDPEGEDTEIKIDDGESGWVWSENGYTRVYDGEKHSLKADNLVYVRQKGGENEWVAVPASAITVTSVSPEGDIKNQGTYTVKLSIAETEGILYSGTVGDITLVITPRPMIVTIDPLTAEDLEKTAVVTDMVTFEFEKEGEDRGLVTDEPAGVSGKMKVTENTTSSVEGEKSYTVEFSELKLMDSGDKTSFLADNYTPTFKYGDTEIKDGEGIVIEIGDITPGGDIDDGDNDDNNWEWDATLEGGAYGIVYDGKGHGVATVTVDGQPRQPDRITYSNEEGTLAEGVLPTDAGSYEAKVVVTVNKESKTGTFSLVIKERPLGIYFDLTGLGEEYIGRTMAASEFVDYREVPKEAISGLVEGEIPGEIKGTISIASEPNANGKYAVTFDGIVPVEKLPFAPRNYEEHYYLNNEPIDLEGEDGTFGDGDDNFEGIEIDDNTGSGSGITTKRYQLYLANKDYNVKDAKEDYAAEGLELFSRHNKKYTNAGGSFTVWYEHDGVANDGGYRIFWSNRANGEYKEVKFDTVSEYFQIRNVQSDVYVKIYAADGFPVGNEEISAADYRAYAQPNKIVVITPQPTDVQIISMAGAVVATDKVTGQREFANLTEGVYIVRMGETVVKLQVRK